MMPHLCAPLMVAADESGRLNLCNACFDVLPDGRLITLLWTFLHENERTIEVHRAFLADQGTTRPVTSGGKIYNAKETLHKAQWNPVL